MRRGHHWWLGLLVLGVLAGRAPAHYHLLLLDKPAVAKDEAVTLTYQFGHPYEHQIFDATAPRSAVVQAPDGSRTNLSPRLGRVGVAGEGGKTVTGFQAKFTPTQRGDHVVLFECDPVWMEEEKHFLHDTVKVILHVQTQNGWDALAGAGFELAPLTRPYGLRAGMVFQAQAIGTAATDAGGVITTTPRSELQLLPRLLVEIERYNATPPKELPPDEHVTRSVKTDQGGVATFTLPEPGWWCVTAQRDGGFRERAGQRYPVRQRSTLWVYVDDKVPLTPVK
jgi:cobalt/nickel transport protein